MAQPIDTLSYSLGILLGDNLKQQGFDDLNPENILKGIQESYSAEGPAMSLEEANANIQREMAAIKASKFGRVKEDGAAFLKENSTKEGVVTLPSGLQYTILTEGSGPKPKASDKVTTHYHGMLTDGSVFDSSVDRGQPAAFPVNGVIQGWQEILVMMPVGSKWKIFIPYNLAYGEQGAGASIPPFAALVFDIELISID